MNNHLPSTDSDSDERLLMVLMHYVEERNMPLNVAKEILRHNLRARSSFDSMWVKFNHTLNGKLWKVG
jgi:hypothetical protein